MIRRKHYVARGDTTQEGRMSEELEKRSPNPKEVLAQLDAHIAQIHAQQDAALTPLRELYTGATQNIITLSSGGLVFSIALAQFIHAGKTPTHVGWLLPCAWLLFMLAVVAGTFRLGFNINLHGHRLVYLNKRIGLEKRLNELDPDAPSYQADVGDALTKFATEHDTELMGGRRNFERSAVVCGLSFLLGVVSLTVYALINVPY